LFFGFIRKGLDELVYEMNVKILHLQRKSVLEEFRKKWWKPISDKKCVKTVDDSQISLSSIGGLFILMISAIVVSIVFAIYDLAELYFERKRKEALKSGALSLLIKKNIPTPANKIIPSSTTTTT
jgi:hypothetical protein